MQRLLDKLKDFNDVNVKVVELDDKSGETIEVKLLPDINIDDTLSVLKIVYDWENDIEEFKLEENKDNKNKLELSKKPMVSLSLRGINFESLCEGIKYSMQRRDLKNPIMLMNIYNLIKVYNTSNGYYFDSEDVYFDDSLIAIDLKLELEKEIMELKKEFSLYFLSILKSYNHMLYTDKDNCVDLPNMYKAFFNSSDLLTVCGIFNDSPNIETKDCKLIRNSFEYVSAMLEKSMVGFNLMENFLNLMEKENKIEEKDKEADGNTKGK